jgi:tRNA threonylcarbamoyladenosine modification (KEOPS) complex  Pcc1 subunit
MTQIIERHEQSKKAKANARKRIYSGGRVSVREAKRKIAAIDAAEDAKALRKALKVITLLIKDAKKALHVTGVTARKEERLRRKGLKETGLSIDP